MTLRTILAAAGLAAASAALPAGYVRVPGGATHSSCVHAHAHGARLEQARLPRCAHPFLRGDADDAGGSLSGTQLRGGGGVGGGSGHGSAWKSWSQIAGAAGSSVTALASSWAVPPEPPAAGRDPTVTLFWWNGLEVSRSHAALGGFATSHSFA